MATNSKEQQNTATNDNLNYITFINYVNQLEVLINKSIAQKNAGLYLYKNNARTIVFMLEALSRLFKKLHNKKRFTKMLEQFKFLEDSLGQVDYYYGIIVDADKAESSSTVKKYCTEQALHHASILHAHIIEKWTGSKSNFIKIKEKLKTADWQDATTIDQSVRGFYTEEIKKVEELITTSKFQNMEADVHEIRRKLRWLSIYPQALQGKIQLLKDAKPKLVFKSYMTKNVLSSPFNKLPVKGKHTTTVQLYAPAYYALSYVISTLGEIKDNCLTQHGYTNALMNEKKISPAQAKLQTEKEMGNSVIGEKALLLDAKNLCDRFIKSGALKMLVVSTK
jgi:hypothetical protein